MVAVHIGSTASSNILEGPAPLSSDQDVAYLVDCGTIRRLPCELVNGFVWEDGTADYTVVVQAEVKKAFAVVVHHTASVSSHSSHTVGVVIANFGINISHDQ